MFWLMKTCVLCAPMAFSNATVSTWWQVVWMNVLLGLLLPPNLPRDAYLNFLEHVLHGLLKDVPLHVYQNMWFQHNGALLILLIRFEVIRIKDLGKCG